MANRLNLQWYRYLSLQWWPSWWNLDASLGVLWHVLRHAFVCRNGVDVSMEKVRFNDSPAHVCPKGPNSWWSVSLGL